MAGISDKSLREIAKAIGGGGTSDDLVLDLGLELRIAHVEVDQYIATNHSAGRVSAMGTTRMLFDWSMRTAKKDQVRILREAMEEVGLVEIAENLVLPACSPPTGPGDTVTSSTTGYSGQSGAVGSVNGVTPDQIEKLVRSFPRNQYHTFCHKLVGYTYNESDDLLVQKLNNSREALSHVLNEWVTRTGGERARLEEVLRASSAGGLIYQIFQ